MDKMKAVIRRIEELERTERSVLELLEVKDPVRLSISITSRNVARSHDFLADINGIYPYLEMKLEEIRGELNPLRERIALLSELLDKGN